MRTLALLRTPLVAMSPDRPDSAEEAAARAMIAQATSLLAGRHGEVPVGFLARLYERAVAEDLLRYTAEDLATFAAGAFQFLTDRKSGAPKVRFEIAQPQSAGAIGLIEIANDDMPFLVDSVLAELTERGFHPQLVVHPVFGIERDSAGKIVKFSDEPSAAARRESFIQIHMTPVDEEAERAEIVDSIRNVLGQVRLAVQDWRPMLTRVAEVVGDLKNNPPPLPVDEIAEAIQFLDWLRANNFTFLGLRDYVVDGNELKPVAETRSASCASPTCGCFAAAPRCSR